MKKLVFFLVTVFSFALVGCGTSGVSIGFTLDTSPGVRDLTRLGARALGLDLARNAVVVTTHMSVWVEVVAYDSVVGQTGPYGRFLGIIEDTDPRGEIPMVFRIYADADHRDYLGLIARVVRWEAGRNASVDLLPGEVFRPEGWRGIDPRTLPPQPPADDVVEVIPAPTGVWKSSTTFIQVVNAQRHVLAVGVGADHRGGMERFVLPRSGDLRMVEIHNYVNVGWVSRISTLFTSQGVTVGSYARDEWVKPRVSGRWEAPRVVQVVIGAYDRRDR